MKLLIEVARRLKETVRATDTVERFGGDEFVILVAQLGFTREEAFTVTRIAHQIAAFIAQPYPLSSTVYTLSASIGVLLFNEAQNDAKTILDEADSVMYRAKDVRVKRAWTSKDNLISVVKAARFMLFFFVATAVFLQQVRLF